MVTSVLALAACLFVAKVAWSSYRTEASVFTPQRWPVARPPALDGVTVEEARFAAPSGSVAGWYLPGRERAAVVLCHGSGSDRTGVLADALVLQQAGFGVLLYDSPGHGESEGAIRWGRPELEALRAAVGFVAARPDVDPGRIAALGFSMGGYIVALGAADDPRIRAAVIESAPSDARRHLQYEYRRWGLLSYLPAEYAVKRHGFELDGPTPAQAVARIAPRPVLIVAGVDDTNVPLAMAEELHASAGEPKLLLVVRGAGHGGFLEAPGSGYARDLTAFLSTALLGPR